MLLIQPVRTPHEQRTVFGSFDPTTASWIVSDLKSKLDLQKILLERRGFLSGQSVMRVSELWRSCLTRLRPDLQIVSREFMQAVLSEKLSESEEEWARAPGAAQAAHTYLTQLMPIISHPNGEDMMSEWFADNPAAETRWGRWFKLSARLWRELLIEGYISPAWASGVLANEPDLVHVWETPLIIDLGAELDHVEADLFALFSEKLDVKVLKPVPGGISNSVRALSAYQVFEGKIQAKTLALVEAKVTESKKSKYSKTTTMIAEVKDAVAQTRLWLEQEKLKPHQIALVAPDIEMYWPALSSYLETEGISTQKSYVRRAQTFPEVARWLACLRLRTGSTSEADVELAVFDSRGERTRPMDFQRFKVLYTTIYGREDLRRSEKIYELFKIELEPTSEATRDEFVSWSLKQAPSEIELDRIELVYKKLFEECPMGLKLRVRRWLAYLEKLAAKTEIKLKNGDPDGVACVNLSSAINSPARRMIVMGLTESALKPPTSTSILVGEAMSLAARFGFHLATDDAGGEEFDARWLIGDREREFLLSVPETDFSGSPLAPAWVWIEGARLSGAHDKIEVPRFTRWDELQRSEPSQVARLRAWTEPHARFFERALNEDLGEQMPPRFTLGPIERLSPSAIEDYLNCPFVYASKYLFGLSDENDLDLEVDPARRGTLMHAVFEALTEEPVRTDRTTEEIETVIEEARVAQKIEFADERLWPAVKGKLLDLSRRFLALEKDTRALFPKTRTIGRELRLKGFIDPETGELSRDPKSSDAIPFKGRIDRVDTDQEGHLAIYDYKSSAASLSQHTGWLKKNQIQLLLYAMAVEKGLTELEPQPVVAALYYATRPLTKDFGYKLTDVTQALFDTADRKKNKLTLEERARLFSEGQAKMREAIGGIRAGHFQALPRDFKTCKTCRWGVVCRAPHLDGREMGEPSEAGAES